MKIKITVAAAIFVFWVVITALTVTSLIFYENGKQAEKISGAIATSTSQNASEEQGVEMAEVAKHNSAANCWIVVNQKVYDVTPLIKTHSGGAGAISEACGRDATRDFETKNGTGSHARGDLAILENYYVATLKSSSAPGNNAPTKKTSQNITSQKESQSKLSTQVVLSLGEVSKHNISSDCWMIIDKKVYNLTSFFGSHPGGDKTLVSSCGTDATTAFDTRGGTGAHSQSARGMLPQFYIGDIGATTTIFSPQGGVPSKNPQPIFSGEDDD